MSEHLLGLVAATGICLCAVACASAMAPPAADQSVPTIHLTSSEKTFGCLEARGELVVLIKPEIGVLVLAATRFPGAELVGEIEGARVRFSFPGLRLREQSADSEVSYAVPLQLWGMAIVDIDSQALGCFGMDLPKNVDTDALKDLVRRKVVQLTNSPPR